jgi:hypothetical protein
MEALAPLAARYQAATGENLSTSPSSLFGQLARHHM